MKSPPPILGELCALDIDALEDFRDDYQVSGPVHAAGEEDAVVEPEQVAHLVDEEFAATGQDEAATGLKTQLALFVHGHLVPELGGEGEGGVVAGETDSNVGLLHHTREQRSLLYLNTATELPPSARPATNKSGFVSYRSYMVRPTRPRPSDGRRLARWRRSATLLSCRFPDSDLESDKLAKALKQVIENVASSACS